MRKAHLVTPLHLERLALICTPVAARGNEATEPPPDQVRLARSLGWPTGRIATVESLMGRSEGGWSERAVLERLVDEVSEWRVGVVLGLESSGIARNSSDLFELIDSCRATGTLLSNGDGIHAPALQRELVVLGDQELPDFDAWIVRGRLVGFKHESVDRFEVSFKLPVGYARDRLRIRKNPNPAVRESVRKTIERVREFGNADAAAQALSEEGFQLPYRDDLETGVSWGAATPDRVIDLIDSPCMAGAYLYGRCRLQRSTQGRQRARRVLATGMHENRSLLIMNHHEPYLAWDEWIELQEQLGVEEFGKRFEPVRWQGSQLLEGLAVCGRCGGKVTATSGNAWRYGCIDCASGMPSGPAGRCLTVSGALVDSEAVRLFLSGVLPGGFEASRLAVERFPAMADEIPRSQWLELDWREYEAALAYRRYRDISPEFELAARELKLDVEAAEVVLEEARASFARTRAGRPDLAMPTLLERFARLGARLESVWNAAPTTDSERRGLLRILLEEVELRPEPERGWVRMLMRWQGGATDEEWLPLR